MCFYYKFSKFCTTAFLISNQFYFKHNKYFLKYDKCNTYLLTEI